MTAEPPAPRRRRQLGLRTTILLVVVAALGLNIARDRRVLRRLLIEATRLAATRRPLLDATDPRQVALVRLDPSRGLGQSWEVDLPPGGRYRLCLATRLGRPEDPPAHHRSAPIEPGRHLLSLDQQRVGAGWRLVATWNLVDRLAVAETADWSATGSWSSAHTPPPRVPLGRAVTLEDRTNESLVGITPADPSASIPEVPGVRLWIETAPE